VAPMAMNLVGLRENMGCFFRLSNRGFGTWCP
jgi:hypothetical protein